MLHAALLSLLRLAPVLKLGFMGSRQGLSVAQVATLSEILLCLGFEEAHHGDCVGSDAEFHDLVEQIAPQASIVIHPPSDDALRAFKKGHISFAPQGYLARDEAIVAGCDLVVATPGTFASIGPSGTWWAVDYARQIGKGLLLVLPDGSVTPTDLQAPNEKPTE